MGRKTVFEKLIIEGGEMIKIKSVTDGDEKFWLSLYGNAKPDNIKRRIAEKRGFTIFNKTEPIGIIAYNDFWDELPFLNLIKILPEYRRCGFGARAMELFEDELKKSGYHSLLVSTQTDEEAQCFYRKIGYSECGCLVLNDEPLKQPMEMFFIKTF